MRVSRRSVDKPFSRSDPRSLAEFWDACISDPRQRYSADPDRMRVLQVCAGARVTDCVNGTGMVYTVNRSRRSRQVRVRLPWAEGAAGRSPTPHRPPITSPEVTDHDSHIDPIWCM